MRRSKDQTKARNEHSLALMKSKNVKRSSTRESFKALPPRCQDLLKTLRLSSLSPRKHIRIKAKLKLHLYTFYPIGWFCDPDGRP